MSPLSDQPAPADLIVVSARIWDQTSRAADAIAVVGDRIAAVGTTREVVQMAGPETRVLDAGGRRLIPGLIDSHLHLVRAGRTWDDEVRWDDQHDLFAALADVSAKAETMGPGHWLGVMGGWHPHQFDQDRPPSVEDLDAAAPHNPVFVQRAYAETFLNTMAMEQASRLMGHRVGPRVSSPADMAMLRARIAVDDIERAKSGTRNLLRELNRLGLVGAIDASGFGMTPESYDAVQDLFGHGERGFRIRLLVGASNPGDEMADITGWIERTSPGAGDAHLRYLGAGEVLDYAAHDLEGLQPKDISTRRADLAAISRHLAEREWTVHLHSILDSSIEVLLEAWEDIGPDTLSKLRFAICHADQIGERNLGRVRDLGVGITVQNGMSMRGHDCAPSWGDSRVRGAPPLKSILDHGIPVAAGTDGTVACTYNPWRCISWMVSGESVDGYQPRVESELLTRDEALRLYTTGSAWFSFEEDSRGTLDPGSLADFVVLSEDVLEVPVDRIGGIESVLTVVGGATSHDSGACGDQRPR